MASRESIAELLERARAGDPRATARLITVVEEAAPALPELASAVTPFTGHAQVIGITGAPGVGKSTSTSVLVKALRAEGKRVAVLAVDPSSPFSGGALLGDRIRMQDHALDGDVFIRSMSSRGHLGGVSWATPQAVRVLDGVGFDVVLVETVGVGQAEVQIASVADTTLVLLAPGMGDGIQAAKAGILEIADILVVNKADRDGADSTVRDLKAMLALGGRHSIAGSWRPVIVKTAADRGDGVPELLAAMEKHREWLISHGQLQYRRRERAAVEIEEIALATLRQSWSHLRGQGSLQDVAQRVVDRELDPYAAADMVVSGNSGLRSGNDEG